MSFILCGQTGIMNRGCEAIVRSTVKLLNTPSGDIYLATYVPQSDASMSRSLGINQIAYATYPNHMVRLACVAAKAVNRNSLLPTRVVQIPLFSRLEKGDICLNIGGDLYCYGNKPLPSIALNKFTYKRGIKNILWCCSVEQDMMKSDMLKDLNTYSYIFAREQLTYQNLLHAGILPEKVIKCCDPAFFLDSKETKYPKGFLPGNTVGINLSELVVKEKGDIVYRNVVRLIRYLLEETDMHICLIPHVYDIDNNKCDWPILKALYEELKCDRLGLVDSELGCQELKFIISKCRFMIAARTHASIAAYSSCVPTIVLGYSVKSKGIATDLFGTYQDYVIPYNDIQEEETLVTMFRTLMNREQAIRNRLTEVLPIYRNTLTDAMQKYVMTAPVSVGSICKRELCSGCSACANSCPKNCITMDRDVDGFLYPKIDSEKCIHCGKCKDVCPSLNKWKDDGKQPETFVCYHRDESIRMNSSSGGVFRALAEKILEKGGVVLGAAFDNSMLLSHRDCQSTDMLKAFMGSKYVQSEIRDSFKMAKQYLDEGRMLLFTGTPCQVAGLLKYLGRDYDNLITQDIICHGVPSPRVFEKYLRFLEKRHKGRIVGINFRSKPSGWKNFYLRVVFDNQRVYSESFQTDWYMRGFCANYFLRQSCYLCSSKQIHRMSDLTLGDYWGADNVLIEKTGNKGLTIVLAHTEKGKKLLSECDEKICMDSVSFPQAVHKNDSYYTSADAARMRNTFMREIRQKDFGTVASKYLGQGIQHKIERLFYRNHPYNWGKSND